VASFALRRYFDEVYPARTGTRAVLFFRHGEAERIRVLRTLLPDTTDMTFLDAGCGDGVCLEAAMRGAPQLLRLEDICLTALSSAVHRLRSVAQKLEYEVVDTFEAQTVGYDVVLAIGLLDYQEDLSRRLGTLLNRSRGVLIVSIPRADRFRNWLRMVWLRLHGLRLQMRTRRQIYRLAASLGCPGELVQARYEHFIRILVKPGHVELRS
jgi:2-polyprenyl-3-methyl-5-hydroxy-6-metoxy-1,4-benzoquinol methylase